MKLSFADWNIVIAWLSFGAPRQLGRGHGPSSTVNPAQERASSRQQAMNKDFPPDACRRERIAGVESKDLIPTRSVDQEQRPDNRLPVIPDERPRHDKVHIRRGQI